MIKVGDVLKNTSGRDVRIICTDRNCTDGRRVVGLSTTSDGVEVTDLFDKDGKSINGANLIIPIENLKQFKKIYDITHIV